MHMDAAPSAPVNTNASGATSAPSFYAQQDILACSSDMSLLHLMGPILHRLMMLSISASYMPLRRFEPLFCPQLYLRKKHYLIKFDARIP